MTIRKCSTTSSASSSDLPTSASLIIDNKSYELVANRSEGNTWDILIEGENHEALVQDELAYRVAKAEQTAMGSSGATVRSPMPGVILQIPVEVGSKVRKGDTVIILESMKMENELKAPCDGVIQTIYITVGASVEKNQNLVTVGQPEE